MRRVDKYISNTIRRSGDGLYMDVYSNKQLLEQYLEQLVLPLLPQT